MLELQVSRSRGDPAEELVTTTSECIDYALHQESTQVIALSHSGALARGMDLPTTVMPFILRGVRLQGVDSVMAALELRDAAWARLATDLPAEMLESILEVVPLSQVIGQAQAILDGQVRGRLVVDPNR